MYYLLAPFLMAGVSWLTAGMAQAFASYFWEDINPVTAHANKPSMNPTLIFAINNLFVGIGGTIMLYAQRWYLEELSVYNILKDVFLIYGLTLLYDLQTYIFHRTSHHYGPLKKMHAIHHEYNMPNGVISSVYGDVLENIIIVIFALWPLSVFMLPIGAVLGYLSVIVFFVQFNHSGKKVVIPGVYTYIFHYNHHKYRTCNYCEHSMVWDWLFGTLNLSQS